MFFLVTARIGENDPVKRKVVLKWLMNTVDKIIIPLIIKYVRTWRF